MVLGGILLNRSRAVSGNDEHKYALFPSHVNFTRILSSLKDKTHRAPFDLLVLHEAPKCKVVH